MHTMNIFYEEKSLFYNNLLKKMKRNRPILLFIVCPHSASLHIQERLISGILKDEENKSSATALQGFLLSYQSIFVVVVVVKINVSGKTRGIIFFLM